MGGDKEELRYNCDSEECDRMKVMLNDCAKFAVILRKHMDETGESLEDL